MKLIVALNGAASKGAMILKYWASWLLSLNDRPLSKSHCSVSAGVVA